MTFKINVNKITRQIGEYKVDVTRHPKFPLAFGELASGGFPHCPLPNLSLKHPLSFFSFSSSSSEKSHYIRVC
jgi:hypothetical protein